MIEIVRKAKEIIRKNIRYALGHVFLWGIILFARMYKSRPLIIITFERWRLCNRLDVFANFIALSEMHKLKIIYPLFGKYRSHATDDYALFFKNTANDYLCSYPPRRSKIQGRICIYSRYVASFIFYFANEYLRKKWDKNETEQVYYLNLVSNQFYDLEDDKFMKILKTKKIIIVDGHLFRVSNIKQYADIIRKFFSPKNEIILQIDEFVNRCRKNRDLLVGIHIRHTDFANVSFTKVFNGSAYYDVEVYKNLMRKAQNMFHGKTIRFLVCSDEKLDDMKFYEFDCVMGSGDLISDLYSLARCDYIIGPCPSTFCRWASFYGNVPLYWFRDPEKSLESDLFKVYDSTDWN
jgi:hypothetical protein